MMFILILMKMTGDDNSVGVKNVEDKEDETNEEDKRIAYGR